MLAEAELMAKDEERKFFDWSEVPLTVSMPEAAAILGVHLNTVRKMVETGELPHFKIGRAVRINKVDLMRRAGLNPQEGPTE